MGGLSRRGAAIIAAIIAGVVVLSAYTLLAPARGVEYVRIDGSSTVFPITSAWAEDFNNEDRQVTVGISGTGGGFAKFCRGETDLSDASRPIKPSELEACTGAGITPVEFLVAYDGLSVVVPAYDLDVGGTHDGNSWVQHFTVRELCRIWTSNTSTDACGGAGPGVTRWNELNGSWPDEPIKRFGPGTDSGTYDYFKEVVLTHFGAEITSQFSASEDDNVLVAGVSSEKYSIGYFGYAYVVDNLDVIRAVPIDDENPTNGDGPIAPSEQTIKDGTYTPLSRPLFIYAKQENLNRDVIVDFLRFGFSARGMELVRATGYVDLAPAEIQTQLAKLPS